MMEMIDLDLYLREEMARLTDRIISVVKRGHDPTYFEGKLDALRAVHDKM